MDELSLEFYYKKLKVHKLPSWLDGEIEKPDTFVSGTGLSKLIKIKRDNDDE